jgi:hypothetical protein
VLKSKIDAPALKSHVPTSNNRRLKLGGKGGERVGESQLGESWESRNECAKLGQRLEKRWVAYILELGWATRSSGVSHRNFRSNEIRPLGLSVNSGSPELSVPGPELPDGAQNNSLERECARKLHQPGLPVPDRNFRWVAELPDGDRNKILARGRAWVPPTGTSGVAHRNFRCTSLQPTKLQQEHFLSPFCQLDLYPSW